MLLRNIFMFSIRKTTLRFVSRFLRSSDVCRTVESGFYFLEIEFRIEFELNVIFQTKEHMTY